MRTWERGYYKVVEIEHNYGLHAFEVVQDGKVISAIWPDDEEAMQHIINELDAGADVNGWENGMGGTVHVERKITPLDYVTTVKGYSLQSGIHVRTVQRMCEDGRLKAKNVHGVWLILLDEEMI